MKSRTLLTVLALCSSLFALHASAETITLTIDQCYALAAQHQDPSRRGALHRLDDGVTHVIKPIAKEGEPEAEPRIVQTAYDFSAATRLAIYRDLRAILGPLEDFEKSRVALVRKIWGDQKPDESKDLEQMKRLREELAELAAVKQKLELTRLKPEELLRNGNPIPNDVLLALQPLLEEPKK